MNEPTLRIGSNELCLLRKGEQYLREKFFFTWNDLVLAEKVPKHAARTIFDKFSVFKENLV